MPSIIQLLLLHIFWGCLSFAQQQQQCEDTQVIVIPGILNPQTSPAYMALRKTLEPWHVDNNPVPHRPLHLIWISLTGSRLGALYARNLRNFALIHASPSSPVFIWSNELSLEFVASIGKEADQIRNKTIRNASLPSRHLHMIRYDLVSLFKDQPGQIVANRIATLTHTNNARLFAVHTSDLLRYFLIWKFGGFYSDLDILPLRPLLSFPAGWISVDTAGTSQTTCVTPPVRVGPWVLNCLCNGLLTFNRGDLLLHDVLTTAHMYFPHSYHQYNYGVIGAILILNSLRKFPEYYELRPHTGDYAMCNAWKDEYGKVPTNATHFRHLRRRCSVAHIYGQGQSDMEIQGGPSSLLAQLYAAVEMELISGDGIVKDYDPRW